MSLVSDHPYPGMSAVQSEMTWQRTIYGYIELGFSSGTDDNFPLLPRYILKLCFSQ